MHAVVHPVFISILFICCHRHYITIAITELQFDFWICVWKLLPGRVMHAYTYIKVAIHNPKATCRVYCDKTLPFYSYLCTGAKVDCVSRHNMTDDYCYEENEETTKLINEETTKLSMQHLLCS